MWLIIIYLIFMIIGDISEYFIGSAVDRVWPAASPPVFPGTLFRVPVDLLDGCRARYRAEDLTWSRPAPRASRPAGAPGNLANRLAAPAVSR
jgi:hypothetical protein